MPLFTRHDRWAIHVSRNDDAGPALSVALLPTHKMARETLADALMIGAHGHNEAGNLPLALSYVRASELLRDRRSHPARDVTYQIGSASFAIVRVPQE